jgi:hypothetical protein
MNISIVFVIHPKDYEILKYSLWFLKKNSLNTIDKVYIVSTPSEFAIKFCNKYSCIFIDENSICEIKKNQINYPFENLDRSGWLFQQILKLNIYNIIKEENFLIFDSDTILLKKKKFIDIDRFYLSYASWVHEPYFKFIEKVIKIKPARNLSFVSHFMLFNREILRKLNNEIVKQTGIYLNQLILKHTDYTSISGFSEYELYGQFLYFNYPNKIQLMELKSISMTRKKINWFKLFYYNYFSSYDFISFHSHLND